MSIHKSLKTAGKLVRARNVLTRAERIDILEKRRVWTPENGIYALPKTKVPKIKKGGKKKKEKKAEE